MALIDQVAAVARELLTRQHGSISTNQLIDQLSRTLGEPGPIANALMKLATTQLADCATRGAPVMRAYSRMNGGEPMMVRPWLWHAPGVPNDEATSGSRVATILSKIARLSRWEKDQLRTELATVLS
jgi:hypothetical protein